MASQTLFEGPIDHLEVRVLVESTCLQNTRNTLLGSTCNVFMGCLGYLQNISLCHPMSQIQVEYKTTAKKQPNLNPNHVLFQLQHHYSTTRTLCFLLFVRFFVVSRLACLLSSDTSTTPPGIKHLCDISTIPVLHQQFMSCANHC